MAYVNPDAFDVVKRLYLRYPKDADVQVLASYFDIGVTKYFYEGKPLPQYCAEHKICYGTVVSRINSMGLTIEQAIKGIHKPIQYGGMSLSRWCKKNHISYQVALRLWYKSADFTKALKDYLEKKKEEAAREAKALAYQD